MVKQLRSLGYTGYIYGLKHSLHLISERSLAMEQMALYFLPLTVFLIQQKKETQRWKLNF